MADKPVMNICFHISKEFLGYTYVAMKSILINNADYLVHFYLLSNSFEESDLKEHYRLAEPYSAEISIVRAPHLLHLENQRTKLEAMIFMEIFFLLPSDIDKILIMDADMVVKASLKDLYETDLSDSYIACLDDACVDGNEVNSWLQNFRRLGSKILSSACCLCNLEKIKKEIEPNDVKAAGQRIEKLFGVFDAELMYATVFKDKIKNFSELKYGLYISEYNCIEDRYSDDEIEKLVDECVIVHYFRTHPWHPGIGFSPLHKIWWEYAEDTPYYDDFREKFWASWKELRKRKVTKRLDALIVTLRREFDYSFSNYKDCRIILYGTGEKTKILIEEMKSYNIVGVLDQNELNTGLLIDNVPVVSLDRANQIGDIVIIATVASVWKDIYLRIKDDLDSRIPIFNLHGENMRDL